MEDLVILAATRTPLGAFQGAFAGVPAPQLGACAIRGAIARAGIEPAAVTDVALGNVLSAGLGQAPARQAVLQAGLPPAVRAVTINKVCGSGMQAVVHAAHALAAGMGTVWIAGGMENMSRVPYLLPQARQGFRLGHHQAVDALLSDGLWDPQLDRHMGQCAESCATRYGFTREQQDVYAIASFQRAQAAQADGRSADEITSVETRDGKGHATSVAHDEGPARAKFERIPQLKPAFQSTGTITAANASTLNDGAAALVITTADHAAAHGWRPLARLVAFGSHAQEPLWFTTAPVDAARQAVRTAGWKTGDIDLWEVNEAFAVVPLAFARELDVPMEKLNVRGGAIALGHPIGASGARILVTLLAALRERGGRRGLAAICIGGGEGLAVCVELL